MYTRYACVALATLLVSLAISARAETGDLLRRFHALHASATAHLHAVMAAKPARSPLLPCATSPAAARLAPPPNDNFASRTPLAGDLLVHPGTTEDATLEPGEPFHPAWGGAPNSIWFTWTAPYSGSFRVDVGSSASDCLLAVFTNSTLATLEMIHNYHTTFLSFDAIAGRAYQIAVVPARGAAPGFVTLELYAELLGPLVIADVITNSSVACFALDDGTALLAPNDDFRILYVRRNQHGLVSRSLFIRRVRTSGITIVDRRGRRLLDNISPPGVSPLYTIQGFDGRHILLFDDDASELQLFRLRRGTLTLVGRQTLPSFFIGELGRRSIVALQVDFGDTSGRSTMGVVLLDGTLAAQQWAIPLAAHEPFMISSQRSLCVVREVLPTVQRVIHYQGGTAVRDMAFPHPAAGQRLMYAGARGELLTWIATGTWAAPVNESVALYSAHGELVHANLVMPGAGAAWGMEHFDGKTAWISTPAPDGSAVLRAVKLARRTRLLGQSSVAFYSYLSVRDKAPVAYQWRELFGDLTGFALFDPAMRRVRWSDEPAAGEVQVLSRRAAVRTLIQPAGAVSNFLARVFSSKRIIAEHILIY